MWYPEPAFDHLFRLTDSAGIAQHALGAVPDRRFGYCTDDNARGLQVVVAELVTDAGSPVRPLLDIYTAAVLFAFDRETGRFRNFMSYDRQWLDHGSSEDCDARAINGLAALASSGLGTGYEQPARAVLLESLSNEPIASSLTAHAIALIGLDTYLARRPDDPAIQVHQHRLATRFRELAAPSEPGWPWPQPVVTWGSGRIPEALIITALAMDDRAMLQRGIELADWLFEHLTAHSGAYISPVGSNGWWPKGESPAGFDQQPVEIPGLVGAALAAFAATGDAGWRDRADLAYRWFLGANVNGTPVYDPATGGCYDGIVFRNVNLNQGAESILACLHSWQQIRSQVEPALPDQEPPLKLRDLRSRRP